MVPRFLAALEAAGARPHRVDAYLTTLGATPESCSLEAWMLMSGHIHAIALSSSAEVSVDLHLLQMAMWPNGGSFFLRCRIGLAYDLMACRHKDCCTSWGGERNSELP